MIASPAQLVGSTSAGEDSIQPVDVPADLAAKERARLERLAADSELVDHLMWSGYQGRDWERFRTELARYGMVVLTSWIRSGRIFAICARGGRRGLRRRPDLEEDAIAIAGETNARALQYFREKVLVPRVWDPNRGASLGTFFVGACVLHFPNVYRVWLRDAGRERPHHGDRDPSLTLLDETRFAHPDQQVELVDAFERAVPDPILQDIFVLEASGYTKEEIAARLGTTLKAVESKLYRFRGLRDGQRIRKAAGTVIARGGRGHPQTRVSRRG